MRLNKEILIFLLILSLASCIKKYTPEIDAASTKKYVVSGHVSSAGGLQEVEITTTSEVGDPAYLPVAGCQVFIDDDQNNTYNLAESTPGIYQVWMEQSQLIPGRSYRVRVNTPEGEQLSSAFDKMENGSPVDSVYYKIEDLPTSDPQVYDRVMQFYTDLNAPAAYSRFYKWDIVETWQYESALPLQYYYDGTIHHISPPDYTNYVCWITVPVKNVFTLSTKNLAQNSYTGLPLHAINGRSARLGILYSILVKQQALSEGAYNYWEKLRINSNEQGGLYEKQPAAIKGNVADLTKPEKDVLGYFYAAYETSKRYFYHDVPGIELDFGNDCYEEWIGVGGWHNVEPWEYPVYFHYRIGMIYLLTKSCIDCRERGGTTVKPDFWPR